MLAVLLIAAVIGVIPAAIAQSKGRSFFAWYIYGTLLFIVALIHSLVLQPDHRASEQAALASGEMRRCPACAELVRREAVVCRHCGRDLPAFAGPVNPYANLPSYHDPNQPKA